MKLNMKRLLSSALLVSTAMNSSAYAFGSLDCSDFSQFFAKEECQIKFGQSIAAGLASGASESFDTKRASELIKDLASKTFQNIDANTLGTFANDVVNNIATNMNGETGKTMINKLFEGFNDGSKNMFNGLGDQWAGEFSKMGKGASKGPAEFIREGFNLPLAQLLAIFRNNALMITYGVTGAGMLFMATWYGLYIAKDYLAKMLMKPTVEMETSPGFFGRLFGSRPERLEDLVLTPETRKSLARYRDMVRFAKDYGEDLPNLLMYGPPGTGKTEAAKRIAKSMNMNYKFLSASDIKDKLGAADGLVELQNIFEQDNMILFIDEIETLLEDRMSKREQTGESSTILNKFLAHTGTRSKKYCIIGATNLPQVFDPAVVRRFDIMVEVALPGQPEREELFIKYLKSERQNKTKGWFESIGFSSEVTIENNFLNMDYVKEISKKSDGLSGAEIKDICHHAMMHAKMSEARTLTKEMFEDALIQVAAKKKLFADFKAGLKTYG